MRSSKIGLFAYIDFNVVVLRNVDALPLISSPTPISHYPLLVSLWWLSVCPRACDKETSTGSDRLKRALSDDTLAYRLIIWIMVFRIPNPNPIHSLLNHE